MADQVFHQGDLSSGISRAIQENKAIACFVREDANHESQIWEDFWLANKSQPTDVLGDDAPPLAYLLQDKAVLLRIEYGSQEMEFLGAFCPVGKAPTLVIIRDGNVLERIEGGVTQEDFGQRVMRACGLDSSSATALATATDASTTPRRPMTQEEMDPDYVAPSTDDTTGQAEAPAQVEPATSVATREAPQESNVQTLLTERAQRLEADRRRKEAAEKAERTARATARRKEAEEAATAHVDKGKQRAISISDEKQKARDQWIVQQKQRKDEAKRERERILAQIESDKQERKAQALRQREMQSAGGDGAFSEIPNGVTGASVGSKTRPNTTMSCALQIRLFDGSSIRGKFAADADIATAVRTWVDEASPEGGADIPYTFRQILAPQPSRSIEVGEEHQSLRELGLTPTATLVLVPVEGYTTAYTSTKGGYASSVVSAAYSGAGSVSSFLSSLLSYLPGGGGVYMGGTADEQEKSNVEGARMDGGDSGTAERTIRTKTLADQRVEQDKKRTEFYNGNSSAFESRKDDDNE